MALAFIPNPNNYPEVNHKDENPSNPKVDNLEWCTSKYNNNYGTKNQRTSEKLVKQVFQYDKKGNLIRDWKSTKECRDGGFNDSSVSTCSTGKRKTYKKYVWSYKPLTIEEIKIKIARKPKNNEVDNHKKDNNEKRGKINVRK